MTVAYSSAESTVPMAAGGRTENRRGTKDGAGDNPWAMRASKDCVSHLNVTDRIMRDKRDGKRTAPQHNPGMMLERAKDSDT